MRTHTKSPARILTEHMIVLNSLENLNVRRHHSLTLNVPNSQILSRIQHADGILEHSATWYASSLVAVKFQRWGVQNGAMGAVHANMSHPRYTLLHPPNRVYAQCTSALSHRYTLFLKNSCIDHGRFFWSFVPDHGGGLLIIFYVENLDVGSWGVNLGAKPSDFRE